MTESNFSPFDILLDRESTVRYLLEATNNADDGELYLERFKSENLLFDDGRLKTASYNSGQGFGLRSIWGEVTGYAHSSEISEKALNRAKNIVIHAKQKGGGSFASSPKPNHAKIYTVFDPINEISFRRKVELLREIDDFARSLDRRIIQVSASISSNIKEITILRPDNRTYTDKRPMIQMRVSVIVEQNGKRESGSDGIGGRFSLSIITEPVFWQKLVKEALRIALINLESIPAPAGVMDVVLGPGWPGILLHEAVGHGLEGDFNRKGSSAFSNLMGKKVAAKEVTVLDDGTLPNKRGSLNFDDEGTPSKENVLIKDGILVGYMQDRQNARLMGLKPSGNGRRQTYAHTPMPRMTNTYMKEGSADPKDLITELKNGIYATGFGGGQVDITNGKFVFSCTEAYKVENGTIGVPLQGATIIGDGPTALKKIRAIGNDLEFDPGLGTCGKNGQWVPVGVGLPTIKIDGLTVGGTV